MTLENFTQKELGFCEYWLKSYTRMWKELTDPRFTQFAIKKLIEYELLTRKRRDVIARLVGRLYRLRREATMGRVRRYLKNGPASQVKLIMFNLDDNDAYMEGIDERERDRELSGSTSEEGGR